MRSGGAVSTHIDMSAYSADPPKVARRPGAGPLARYVVAATLVRAADAAAAVGLVLLATRPAAHVAGGARTGGLLAAGLTAPHLLGPLLARRLDAARRARARVRCLRRGARRRRAGAGPRRAHAGRRPRRRGGHM